jgi:hypothetical protein
MRSEKGWVKTLALTLVAKLELVYVDESCQKLSWMKRVRKKTMTGDGGLYTTHGWLVWKLQAIAQLMVKCFPWTK